MKKLFALLICILLLFALASCSDNTCEHKDADKDHDCDYNCGENIGTCVDADKNHACDYGCEKTFGEHTDGNDDNHLCDYGCEKIADDGCYDTVVDGKCDECSANIEHICVDEYKNHACDICSTAMGDHIDTNKDHNCDYGCANNIGACEDGDKDHDCDYGCDKAFGTCEDEDKDHNCDYGCNNAIGNCVDADKNHACDYGCEKTFGEHTDGNDDNHLCDYGCEKIADDGCYDTVVDGKCDECGADIEHTCVDEYKNHACDICSTAMGDHIDTNKDHYCDYGCANNIGACEDGDKDHDCDYGCNKAFGTCEDEDKDHACDYGCEKTFGEHTDGNDDNHLCDYGCEKIADDGCCDTVVDGNCDECGADIEHACVDEYKNHACDICSTAMGDHMDTNKDHTCDYGCNSAIGNCVDADKNHDCDYGCDKAFGTCEDGDKDHDCDYGCDKAFGTCEDEDKDHNCDYGCNNAIGNCVDADKDHACDYGCEKSFGEHSDSNADDDHVCDYGCKKIADDGCYDTVVDGKCDECGADIEHTCVDEYKNHACDICSTSMGDHIDTNKDHYCDYGCANNIGACEDSDKDHDCDYGCNKAFGTCEDEDKDHNCDYGCNNAIGNCVDADKDHACDYGCEKAFGEHSDSSTDDDHVCDYGCKATIEYIATFKDGDMIIDTVKYTIETDSIIAPAVPIRVGYTGVWESYSLDEENITVNAIYTAIEYTATFMDGTTVVDEVKFTVETESITEPAVPTHNGYIGSWESYTLGTEDITIKAVYSIKQYIITWKNNDGTLIKTTNCDHGSIPYFGSETPTKPSDSRYSYIFAGWATELDFATEDATYIATYTKVPRTSYTISYDANGGTNAPPSQDKTKGSSITLSSVIPTNEGSVFMGWRCANDGKLYKAGESFNVDFDVTLYAVWGHNCSTCGGDGKVSSTYTCSSCSGSGKIPKQESKETPCSKCNGAGSFPSSCSSCIGGMTNIIYYCACGDYTWPYNVLGQTCPYCRRRGSIFDYNICGTCGGDGVSSSKCSDCSGSGYKTTYYTAKYDCSSCEGSGRKTTTNTCSTCDGDKTIIDTYDTHIITLKNGNSIIGTYSVSVNAPYKLTVPTKNGYTFLGWFDSTEGGIPYTDADGISLSVWSSSKNKTLYARWSLNYYTITYDCDHSVNIDNMPFVYTVEDQDILLNVQHMEHYSFKWELDQETVTYIDTSLAKDVVVKGIWAPIEYTIVYDLDGGTSSNVTHYNIESNTFSLSIPTKIGHTFIGWTGSNGQEPTKTITIQHGTYGDLTYKANWIPNEYTITFVSNGGSPVESITQIFGTSVSLPTNLTWTERSFVGWFDSTLTTQYSFTTMPAENVTLYAKWEPIVYNIIYKLDGGENNGENPATYTIENGNITLVNPTRKGYTFAGWTGTGLDSATFTVTIPSGSYGNRTYTANWTAKTYSIYFNANSGSGASSTKTATYDATMPIITSTPTRTGYIFLGYFDASSGGTKYYNADLSSARTWDKTSNATLYAQWEAITYTVVFNATGGSGSISRQEFTYGTANTLTSNAFSRTGYTFVCWTTSPDGTGTSYSNMQSVINLASTEGTIVNLYAKWKANTYTITLDLSSIKDSIPGEYNVSFNLNGASGTAPATQTVTDTIGLIYPTIPTRSGYIFAGWYTTSSCTGNPYDFTADITENITLYAKWVVPSSYSGVLSIGGNTGSISFSSTVKYYPFVSLIDQTITIYTSHSSGDPMVYLYNSNKTQLASDDDGYGNRDSKITYTVTAGTLYYAGFGAYSSGTGVMYIDGTSTPTAGGAAGATMNTSLTKTLTYDSPFMLEVPLRNGYAFEGWYDGEDGTGTQYTDANGNSVRIWDKSENTTLYPKWTAIFNVSNGTITGLTNYGKTLTEIEIPKSIDGVAITAIGDYVFKNNLLSVTIPESITSIGSSFYGCTNLEKIYFNATAMNDLSSSSFAFYNVGNNGAGVTVVIGKNVTKIPAYLFYPYTGARKIVSVEFEDGSVCSSIGSYAFSKCSSLTSITIPSGVTSIGASAFSYCTSLTSIAIPNSVTSMGSSVFSNCTNLIDVTIGNGVTSIDSFAFYCCENLSVVRMSEKVTQIGTRAFGNCINLINMVIPSGVKIIDSYAFSHCESLVNITIPVEVEKIGSGAFEYCSSIEEIYFGAASMNDLTSSSSVFAYVGQSSNGISVTIGNRVTAIPAYLFSSLTSTNAPKLTSVIFEENSICDNIGDYAFNRCVTLKTLEIGDSVTNIGFAAFEFCTKLTGVIIPNSVVTIENGAFGSCGSIESIVIPDSVTSIGVSAFSNCDSLREATISATIIGQSAFDDCDALVSVIIGKGVTTINSRAFTSCQNLTQVYNLSSLNIVAGSSSNGDVGYYAQGIHVGTTEHTWTADETLTSTCTKYEVIEKCSVCAKMQTVEKTPVIAHNFVDCKCTMCGKIDGSEGLAYSLLDDGTYRVDGMGTCKDKDVVIPAMYEGKNVTEIAASAFKNKSITSITIPEHIKTIGSEAFYMCTRISNVYFNATLMNDLGYNNMVFYSSGGAVGGFNVVFGANVERVPSRLFHPHYTYGASEHSINRVTFSEGSVCQSIGYDAFRYTGLYSITLPDSVKTVESGAFACNENLRTVVFGSGVENIGSEIFYSCSKIQSITIPASVKKISANAFYACALTEIIFERTTGWSCTDGTTTVTISSASLSNSTTAKTYLKETYRNYVWNRY